MTCRGYDAKAVKLPKEIKTRAATIMDKHVRGAFIKSFTRILEGESRQRANRNQERK